MSRKVLAGATLVALAAGLAVAAAATAGAHKRYAVSGSISMVAIWSGEEQKSFQAVLAGFHKKFPGVKVTYTSGGNNTPTILQTAVQGGKPPDVAAVSQPSLVTQFVGQGKLKPITFAQGTISANYAPVWRTLGSVKGKLYGLFFKGANKSTVWYNVPVFKSAGVTAPKTWPQLQRSAQVILGSGVPPYSFGGANGWTLTDVFENIYLRQAGAAKYDQLTAHTIKWTDPSVKAALKTMGTLFASNLLAGGTSGTLQTDFPTSVTNVFTSPPKASMTFEGDFVESVITSSTKAKPGTDFNVFAFPQIGSSPPSVEGGGDEVIMFKDSPASRALITYLAGPEAATIWAKRGGFSSPNKKVPLSAYADPLLRTTTQGLVGAKVVRFDMSDLQPTSFGSNVQAGEWKLFQDFVRNPSNVNGIAAQLEAARAKAK
jgi:alpha-glucoside transport system substrate-binding protein